MRHRRSGEASMTCRHLSIKRKRQYARCDGAGSQLRATTLRWVCAKACDCRDAAVHPSLCVAHASVRCERAGVDMLTGVSNEEELDEKVCATSEDVSIQSVDSRAPASRSPLHRKR